MCASWFGDVGKTLLGTVVGALLAFALGRRAYRLQKLDEYRAAGNLAMAVISQHLNDVVATGEGFRAEVAAGLTRQPGAPAWLVIPTMSPAVNRTASIDLGSLGFLLVDAGNASLISSLAHAQTTFEDFVKLLDLQYNTRVELQQKAAEAKLGFDGRPVSVSVLSEAVGPDLVKRLEAAIDELLERFDADERIYRQAGDVLYKAMYRYFKGRGALYGIKPQKSPARAEQTTPASSA